MKCATCIDYIVNKGLCSCMIDNCIMHKENPKGQAFDILMNLHVPNNVDIQLNDKQEFMLDDIEFEGEIREIKEIKWHDKKLNDLIIKVKLRYWSKEKLVFNKPRLRLIK